jgi:small subunit ribosomal protein S7
MSPRLNLFSIARKIPYRPRPQTQWRIQPQVRVALAPYRSFADARDRRVAEEEKEAVKPLPHISEEVAKTAEIEGKEGPDLEQGTPVEDVSRLGITWRWQLDITD